MVAGEVRSLAQRCARLPAKSRQLINESASKSAAVRAYAAQARPNHRTGGAVVKQVTSLMSQMTSATGEQSVGIGQVNDAVNRLDSVTPAKRQHGEPAPPK